MITPEYIRQGEPETAELVAMCRSIGGVKDRPETVDVIIREVMEYYGQEFDIVKRKGRKREHVLSRQIIMYFLDIYTDMTLRSIGKLFEGKTPEEGQDHSTVLHALDSVNNLRETDKKFNAVIERLNKEIDFKL